MDRFALLLYGSLPAWLAGSRVAWLALVVGVLATAAIILPATADPRAMSDPDALLGPIRWDSLPANIA